jgi:hypothetical protein
MEVSQESSDLAVSNRAGGKPEDVNALLDKGGVSGLSQIGSFRAKFGLC